MSNPHMRRKEPEVVRKALLESAARIAAERGFGAVTLETVAKAANVTKGGLYHHFANKQALIEAMLGNQINELERAIETHIKADTIKRGRFTRAYITALFSNTDFHSGSVWDGMASSVTSDKSMRAMWSEWFTKQLGKHADTDSGMELETVRLAADGAWLNYLIDGAATQHIEALEKHLLSLTLRD